LIQHRTKTKRSTNASSSPTWRGTPGSAGDTTADAVLGQGNFNHSIANFIDGSGIGNTGCCGTPAVEKIRGVKMMRRGLSIDGDTSAVEAIVKYL
jgi:hypothetical protein